MRPSASWRRPAPRPMSCLAAARAEAAGAADEVRRSLAEEADAKLAARWLLLRREERRQLEQDGDKVITLAIALAERLLDASLELGPERIVALARRVIAEAGGARRAVVEAHPLDAEALRAHLIGATFDLQSVEVRESAALARGELRLHTDVGIIDARLAPRFQQTRRRPPRRPRVTSRPGCGAGPEATGAPLRWRANAWLFLATVASVFVTGLTIGWSSQEPTRAVAITRAAEFTAALLAILLAHEFGHFIAARLHKVDASLPYFLPLPVVSPFGTMGAVIRMRSVIPTRRALLDIGAAGPLAGLALAIPIYAIGRRSLRAGRPRHLGRPRGRQHAARRLAAHAHARPLVRRADPGGDGPPRLAARARGVGGDVRDDDQPASPSASSTAATSHSRSSGRARTGSPSGCTARCWSSSSSAWRASWRATCARASGSGTSGATSTTPSSGSSGSRCWRSSARCRAPPRGSSGDRLGTRTRIFAIASLALLAGVLREGASALAWGAWFVGLGVLLAMEARWGALRTESTVLDHPPTSAQPLGWVRASDRGGHPCVLRAAVHADADRVVNAAVAWRFRP